MSKVIACVKNIRPIKILTVFCVGMLLIVTQACGSVTAGEPKAGANSELSVPKGDKVLNSYEGGMNNFSDTDPRSKEAKIDVKAKTEALKENSEQNLLEKTSTAGEGTLGKNLEQSAEGTKDKTAKSADNFGKGVQRGIENIKDNTKNAVDAVKSTVKEADD